MRHRIRLLAIAAVLAAPAVASSQSIARDVVYDFNHGIRDFLAVWASPFKGSGRDYLTAGLVGAGVGLSTLGDEPTADWFRDHQRSPFVQSVAGFRDDNRLSFVNVGSGAWLAKGALGVYTVGLLARSSKVRDAGMGCIAAEQAQAIPRGLVVYKTVARERPIYQEIVDGDTIRREGDHTAFSVPGDKNWYLHSFFGGHVANWMACVSFLNHRFHMKYVEPVLWASVAGLAAARMADGRHWLSDNLLGAAVGFAAGKYVAQRSRARYEKHPGLYDKEKDKDDKFAAALQGLFVGKEGQATLLGWRRTF